MKKSFRIVIVPSTGTYLDYPYELRGIEEKRLREILSSIVYSSIVASHFEAPTAWGLNELRRPDSLMREVFTNPHIEVFVNTTIASILRKSPLPCYELLDFGIEISVLEDETKY